MAERRPGAALDQLHPCATNRGGDRRLLKRDLEIIDGEGRQNEAAPAGRPLADARQVVRAVIVASDVDAGCGQRNALDVDIADQRAAAERQVKRDGRREWLGRRVH